ncbi:MAG TPA: undecaprenyl-phosphate glucose phosphotransferase [Flavisolibacter sp.]|nr:undecaprenyl-phosphate glucose phosphotransferase [Flavisolibacter sp.]
MLKESVILIRSRILLDLLLMGVILLAVESNFTKPEDIFTFSPFLAVIATNLLTWFVCGRSFGLYTDLREKPFSIEWIMFLKAFGLYVLATSFIAFQVFKQYPYGRHQFLMQCALIFFTFPVQKLALRILFKRFNNSKNIRRKVLIIGAGKTGMDFYHSYVRNQHFGYQLTGFLDDQTHPALNGHYLGRTTDIEHVLTNHELDDVVVTLPMTQEAQIITIVSIAEREGKRVRLIPNYETFGNGKMQVDRMGNLSMITLRSLPLDLVDNKIVKRLFDIAFSIAVVLCVFSWLFPIIALIIKLSSKGPVLFKQDRWGLNNKVITCWKFRTMIAASNDTDETGRYRQATKNDCRITPFGRFLRKTSLDELPQFFNVLFGSMSVVGPRPHPVPLNLESKSYIDKYMMRHWVKPGITGWAQVNGYRGETKEPHLMSRRVRYDRWYIEHWTFWLDLQIIVQTIVNVVKGDKQAY